MMMSKNSNFALFLTMMTMKKNNYHEGSLFNDRDFETAEKKLHENYADLADLFARLDKSDFRRRFHLRQADRQYIESKGLVVIRRHAEDFVWKRLAPACPPNDGRQTPMRGHPVFIAQHATGCCCRGCLYKWHHIPPGVALTSAQQQYVVHVLMGWIEKESICCKY